MSALIRPSRREDAKAIGALAAALAEHLRSLGDPDPGQMTEQRYVADGFGPSRAFSGLVGEHDGEIVGYLLYCHAYDLDHGGRTLWIIDLFVRESARGRGVGRALMNRAAEICRDAGGSQLTWSVHPRNAIARRFYEKLGARTTREVDFMHWRVPTRRLPSK